MLCPCGLQDTNRTRRMLGCARRAAQTDGFRPVRGGSTMAITSASDPGCCFCFRSCSSSSIFSSAGPHTNVAISARPFVLAFKRASSTAGAQLSTPSTWEKPDCRASTSPKVPAPQQTSSTTGLVLTNCVALGVFRADCGERLWKRRNGCRRAFGKHLHQMDHTCRYGVRF